MRAYLKDALHWMHLALLKPLTLEQEVQGFGWKQTLHVYLKVMSVSLPISLIVLAIVGGMWEWGGRGFYWFEAFSYPITSWLGVGLVLGLVHVSGLVRVLGFALVVCPFVGLVCGLGVGLSGRLSGGPFFGLLVGLTGGLSAVEPRGMLGVGLGVGLGIGMFAGLLVGLDRGLTEALYTVLVCAAAFLLVYARPFYLLPHLVQYHRAMKGGDPFGLIRRSPLYWDEVIALPLPFLTDWLVRLAHQDRERGIAEILFVAEKRPYQRRAAQRALLILATEELGQVRDLASMARAENVIKFIPAGAGYLPRGWEEVRHRVTAIATLAQDHETRVTPSGQLRVLEDLVGELESFRDAMALIEPPLGPALSPIASRWLALAKAAEGERRAKLEFTPIVNPFVVGNPLLPRDHEIFKGRRDIVAAIEENIINTGRRPTLLLYGRRRTGKSSTLLNLPRLLSSRFVPVYIDCQNAKWRDGDGPFCYHLAKTVYQELFQRRLLDGVKDARLEEFERYPFTRLDAYLDTVEDNCRKSSKQVLLSFDEYERLEEGIRSEKISLEVFNQLRNLVQHREQLVVLISGSHRFEELRGVNWSDYLINAKTLELSFLAREDALELITRPVPDFKLGYAPGVAGSILGLTHGQPFLLQALASDLVNHLNAEKRLVAEPGDLEVAAQKVLVTAQAYFFNTWKDDCSEEEREVLRVMADPAAEAKVSVHYAAALQQLARKEIVQRLDAGHAYTVELFRRWVMKEQAIGASQVMPREAAG
ncbi:MAG: AAA family ATPase [Gammaproteobacteria bacterium]